MSFQRPEFVSSVAEELGIGWPILIDPDRAIYRAYRLGRASIARIWSPANVWYHAKAAFRGRFPRRPEGDGLQLGGDFIIDRAGMLRFSHRSKEPADTASVATLLDVLAEL